MKKIAPKLIILSGGGTGGSVTPLLAVADYLKKYSASRYRFLFIGTKHGPEERWAKASDIPFQGMLSGKLRRYFSLRNIFDIILIGLAFFQSFYLLSKYRPALIISAGSFVSVPLVWAGRMMGIKSIIHQQDWRPGLANKLMKGAAKTITVTFEKSLADYGSRAVWIGNPIKEIDPEQLAADQAAVITKYNLSQDKPLILIMGGGTGSVALNRLSQEAAGELAKLGEVIQICGLGKSFAAVPGFQVLEFIPHSELLALESLAQVVVSRCGLGTLNEISYFKKPAILIPLPHSHQEDNAGYFSQNQAAVVLAEDSLTSGDLVQSVKKMLQNGDKYSYLMGKMMKREASQKMAEIINNLL
ncbi:MAG TPA: glycosyltransferase [bacterium]|nr:glycosyltransferase [bacterium]HPT29965.1 glycosyltransferase [bacterium]